jgi:hypothetical protein
MFGQAPAATVPAARTRPAGAPGAFAAHEGGMFSGMNLVWWGLGGAVVLGAGAYYLFCMKGSPLAGFAGLGYRPKRRRR